MRTNTLSRQPVETNAEGVSVPRTTPEQQLRRSIAACLLWEKSFYESGESIADRIKTLVSLCDPAFVAACAFEARSKMNLRHAPLLLVRELARGNKAARAIVSKLLPDVIQRADELAEFLAIYWKDDAPEKRQPLSKQVKLGLATAFGKFNEYQLAKYDRPGDVKLKDVLFLCHAKPRDAAQDALWKKLIAGTMTTPDTWETELSAGADKRATFDRLIIEGKLGAMAFLRNFRNMHDAGIDKTLIKQYAETVDKRRVLPFRYIAAARVVPAWEDICESMLLSTLAEQPKMPGRTLVLLDVSPSMDVPVSAKSEITRMDAAFGLAMVLREICEDVIVYSFSSNTVLVPPRRGFALAEAIKRSQPSNGTLLGRALATVNSVSHDRLIVLTDEQSQDRVGAPRAKLAYMLNVANEKHGVGYGGGWTHIDGWSEACVEYIRDYEATITS